MTSTSTQTPIQHEIKVSRLWQRNLLTFLMVFGPGPIVMDHVIGMAHQLSERKNG